MFWGTLHGILFCGVSHFLPTGPWQSRPRASRVVNPFAGVSSPVTPFRSHPSALMPGAGRARSRVLRPCPPRADRTRPGIPAVALDRETRRFDRASDGS